MHAAGKGLEREGKKSMLPWKTRGDAGVFWEEDEEEGGFLLSGISEREGGCAL